MKIEKKIKTSHWKWTDVHQLKIICPIFIKRSYLFNQSDYVFIFQKIALRQLFYIHIILFTDADIPIMEMKKMILSQL